MSIVEIQTWWLMAVSVATTVLSIVVWLRRPGEEAGRAATKLRELLDQKITELRDLLSAEVSELRIVQERADERMKHVPTRDEVSELSGDMKAVKAQMDAVINTQTTSTMALGRIETWLINRSKS